MKNMIELNQKINRNYGLDWLKILASFLVIILHVSGYAFYLYGYEGYSESAQGSFLLSKAIGLPAVNIFVLVGSYYMVRNAASIRKVLAIYRQTWIVCIIGLIAIIIIDRGGIILTGGMG